MDGGVDASDELVLDVIVREDTSGTDPAVGAPWIAEGADGWTLEGNTDAMGEVSLALRTEHAPYTWTVTSPGLGARSLVGIAAPTRAELRLSLAERATLPDAIASVDFEISGLNSDEAVTLTGPGTRDVRYASPTTGTIFFLPSASYAVVAVAQQRAQQYLPELDLEVPVRGSPLRAVVAVAPQASPPIADLVIDVSTGDEPTARHLDIALPTGGYYRPDVLYVDGYGRTRSSQSAALDLALPVGTPSFRRVGDELQGDLLYFDSALLRPEEVVLQLFDGGGRPLGAMTITPDESRVVIPPVEAGAEITGVRFSALRFHADAPMWSTARFGVSQVLPDGRAVSWIAVAPSGQVSNAGLPSTLPAGLTLEDVGFDRESGETPRAFIEVTHSLRADSPLTDEATVPYIDGRGTNAEGAPRLFTSFAW